MLKTTRPQSVKLLQILTARMRAVPRREPHFQDHPHSICETVVSFLSFRLKIVRKPRAKRLARPSGWPRGATGSSYS
eukprot:586823-Pyramimonas_sp.AAC.1